MMSFSPFLFFSFFFFSLTAWLADLEEPFAVMIEFSDLFKRKVSG